MDGNWVGAHHLYIEKDDLEAIEALKQSTALELKVSLSLLYVCVCVCVNNLMRSKFWGPISVFCLSNQHGLQNL